MIPLPGFDNLKGALNSLPESILNAPGRFLYSGYSCLKPGDFYLLGYNPGGDPNQENRVLRDEIAKWHTKRYSAYCAEKWGSSKYPGQAPYQKRVRALCNVLGIAPCDLCASNYFFTRSKNIQELSQQGNETMTVHLALLEIVNPRIIISIGNGPVSAYAYLSSHLNFGNESSYPSGHGNWNIKAKTNSENKTLIGLPHFSRYKPNEICFATIKRIITP